MERKTKQNNNTNVNLQENPPFALIESFRNLYTNINFAVPKKEDGRGRVVCISSAIAGEGKTTVSVNIASSCASAGAKTILIDCDMRKPAVRNYFPSETQVGMVDYLSGQVSLPDVIINAKRNLDIIAGRKAAPNPLRLVKSHRFEEMLDLLSKEYEYVIIDTPPLSIVSDALAIAENTDGIILITRQMVSTAPVIQQVISDIEFSDVSFLGFVLNAYQSKGSGNKYYRKYYYDKYQSKYITEQ